MAVSSRRPHDRPSRLQALGRTLCLLALAGLAAGCDLILLVVVFEGEMSFPLAAIAHAVVSIGVIVLVAALLRDWRAALVLGLWVTLLGPLGAIAAALALSLASAPDNKALADEEWYQRLHGGSEPENGLVTALRDNRAYQAQGVTLHSFAEIMANGSVNQKQTILGHVAQANDPAFASLLMDALRSPQVAVRASAAAVFARLRDKQAADLRMAEELALSDHHEDVLEAATRFAKAATSGLVSPQDGERARARALALRRSLARFDVVPMAVGQLDERLRSSRPVRQPTRPGPDAGGPTGTADGSGPEIRQAEVRP